MTAKIYAIRSRNHHATAAALREYADRAERGELIGVAIAAVAVDFSPMLEVAGVLHHRPRDAYAVVSMLRDQLLYLDRGRPPRR